MDFGVGAAEGPVSKLPKSRSTFQLDAAPADDEGQSKINEFELLFIKKTL